MSVGGVSVGSFSDGTGDLIFFEEFYFFSEEDFCVNLASAWVLASAAAWTAAAFFLMAAATRSLLLGRLDFSLVMV